MAQEEQQEKERLIHLIGQISLVWSSLEEDLAFLLSAVIANKDERLVAAIFHASTNIEVKLAMIDQPFKVIAPTIPQAEIVSLAWKRLLRRIGKQKTTRNAAIHGTFIMAYGSLSLAPPTFSPKLWQQASRKKERIGVSAHEIEQSINSIKEIREGVRLVANLIWFWRQGNMTAFAERLRSLCVPS